MGFNGIGALPALQVDTGFLNSATPINAFRQGTQDRAVQDQRDLMKNVGQVAATGNYLDAARTAMAGGDVKTGMDISNWDTDRRTKAIDFLTEGAQRADTPEKWNALVGVAENAFGSDLVKNYRDFNSRPAALTALQSAQLKILQANADREARESAVRIPLIQAQTKALGQKDVLNDAISRMILGPEGMGETSGTPNPSVTPPASSSPVRPQSFNGPSPAPSIVPASTTAPVSSHAAPSTTQNGLVFVDNSTSAPSVTAAPSEDQIDTPLGKMTPDRARRLGLGLALAGKGEAGKMMSDAVDKSDLSRTAQSQNDKEELAATGQLATLNSIKQTYNSKYLNVPTRFKLWGKSLQDKFGTLSPQDKKDVQGYANFRQSAWHNLNRVLKDLSGTAVTENEMQRQLLDMPNPGQGLFDGDSPAQFEGKLKGSMAFATSAIARARFLRGHGFTGKPWESGVSIEDMPAIINQRGQEVEKILKQQNPNATPMQLQEATTLQIKKEFGI